MSLLNFLTATDTLTIKNCPVCHIQYAAPQSMFTQKHANGESWCCPNGHSIVFRKTKADELAEQLKRERENNEYKERRIRSLHDQLTNKNHQIRAQKAAKTRLANRIKNGVCPCCTRTFQNLAQHMKTQHPDYRE